MAVVSRVFLAAAALFGCLALAPARAAVVYTGCGADFATGCSLQELVDGGSITVNDMTFTGWSLFDNDADPGVPVPLLSMIRVTGLDDQSHAPGLRYEANGQWTIPGAPADGGALWTYFDFFAVATGSRPITGMSLKLTDYTLAGDGVLAKEARPDADPCGCGVFVGGINFSGDEFDPPFSDVILYDEIVFLDVLGETLAPVPVTFVENDVDVFAFFEGDVFGIEAFEERFFIPAPGAVGFFGLIAALAFARRHA